MPAVRSTLVLPGTRTVGLNEEVGLYIGGSGSGPPIADCGNNGYRRRTGIGAGCELQACRLRFAPGDPPGTRSSAPGRSPATPSMRARVSRPIPSSAHQRGAAVGHGMDHDARLAAVSVSCRCSSPGARSRHRSQAGRLAASGGHSVQTRFSGGVLTSLTAVCVVACFAVRESRAAKIGTVRMIGASFNVMGLPKDVAIVKPNSNRYVSTMSFINLYSCRSEYWKDGRYSSSSYRPWRNQKRPVSRDFIPID